MANTLDSLREHLFAALEGLRDKESPLDIERARAISEVAKTVIDSAKVEVDYLRVRGGDGSSEFLGGKEAPALPPGVTNVRQHRLKG
jgi:hypothetical protein